MERPRAAHRLAPGLCSPQPPHARFRRVDDRPARGRDETRPRNGHGIAARVREGKCGNGADGFVAIPLEVLVRFGRWDEILAEPARYPEDSFSRAPSITRHARLPSGQGQCARRAEGTSHFLERPKLVPKETPMGDNTAGPVLSLATYMLEGEPFAWWRAKSGTRAWRSCTGRPPKEEDALKYDEPPAWMIPVRHSLGAVLMGGRRIRRRLSRSIGTIWPACQKWLVAFGLAESLRAQKKNDDAAAATKPDSRNAGPKPT